MRSGQKLAHSERQPPAPHRKHLWIGIATSYLYDEAREPLTRMRQLLGAGGSAAELQREYDKVAAHLTQSAPELQLALQTILRTPGDPGEVQKKLQAFLAAVPAGYYPPGKLTRTLERVRRTGVEVIVIFSAGGITSVGLWDTVAKSFADEAQSAR